MFAPENPGDSKEAPLTAARKMPAQLVELKAHATAVGLPWAAVRRYLPDWADDAMAHAAGVVELEGFVARHFGLKIRAEGGFDRASLPAALFKLASGTKQDDVADARNFATSVARIVARATRPSWSGARITASSLRATALKHAPDRGWVDLPALVEASWEVGVPVVYLPTLPGTGRKPEGLVTYVGGRPVIVLTKRQAQPDWALFILAHELGHLAHGHLAMTDGAAVIDEHVRDDSGLTSGSSASGGDQQETEANSFASQVVAKGHSLHLKNLIQAEQLAAEAEAFGKKHGISPGHVILNAVRHSGQARGMNLFALGNKALTVLGQTHRLQSTAEVCTDALRRHVDLDLIKDDTLQFLEKLEVL